MSPLNETFFFIYCPDFMSFAVVRVEGDLPEKMPEAFKRLMPGNKTGTHDQDVLVEQDEKWLTQLRRVRPEWFKNLEKCTRESIGDIPYQMVQHYMAI